MQAVEGIHDARLAEGNWEGNHGRFAVRFMVYLRLAEGNWEGNHGRQ